MLQTQFNFIPSTKIYQVPNNGFSQTQSLGYKGEKWAAEALSSLGWSVDMPGDFNAAYDLKIGRSGEPQTLHVEVKTAKISYRYPKPGYRRPRYQFDLSGGLDAKKIDFLYILLAIDETGKVTPFIVPSWAIGNRQHVQITSPPEHYTGRLLVGYRHNWAAVDQVYEIARKYELVRAGQLSLLQ
jgi:hypothetical protein